MSMLSALMNTWSINTVGGADLPLVFDRFAASCLAISTPSVTIVNRWCSCTNGAMWRTVVLGAGPVFGVPIPVLLALFLFVVGMVVLNYTTYGRVVYAVGGDAEASRLAAQPVKRYQFTAYLLSGFSAGLVGVVLTPRLYAAAPQAVIGLEFSVIAADILGGTR